MKKETLKKANKLQERIEGLEVGVQYGYEMANDHIEKPDDVLTRDYKVNLTEPDAEKLQVHIERFIINLRKQLQSEFDSLK